DAVGGVASCAAGDGGRGCLEQGGKGQAVGEYEREGERQCGGYTVAGCLVGGGHREEFAEDDQDQEDPWQWFPGHFEESLWAEFFVGQNEQARSCDRGDEHVQPQWCSRAGSDVPVAVGVLHPWSSQGGRGVRRVR